MPLDNPQHTTPSLVNSSHINEIGYIFPMMSIIMANTSRHASSTKNNLIHQWITSLTSIK